MKKQNRRQSWERGRDLQLGVAGLLHTGWSSHDTMTRDIVPGAPYRSSLIASVWGNSSGQGEGQCRVLVRMSRSSVSRP